MEQEQGRRGRGGDDGWGRRAARKDEIARKISLPPLLPTFLFWRPVCRPPPTAPTSSAQVRSTQQLHTRAQLGDRSPSPLAVQPTPSPQSVLCARLFARTARAPVRPLRDLPPQPNPTCRRGRNTLDRNPASASPISLSGRQRRISLASAQSLHRRSNFLNSHLHPPAPRCPLRHPVSRPRRLAPRRMPRAPSRRPRRRRASGRAATTAPSSTFCPSSTRATRPRSPPRAPRRGPSPLPRRCGRPCGRGPPSAAARARSATWPRPRAGTLRAGGATRPFSSPSTAASGA
jgi:hypothetical protein